MLQTSCEKWILPELLQFWNFEFLPRRFDVGMDAPHQLICTNQERHNSSKEMQQ